MKTEAIIQKSHRYGYDHAVRNCGIRFVEVETREELERAVNDPTVMMLFYNRHADAEQRDQQHDVGNPSLLHRCTSWISAAILQEEVADRGAFRRVPPVTRRLGPLRRTPGNTAWPLSRTNGPHSS